MFDHAYSEPVQPGRPAEATLLTYVMGLIERFQVFEPDVGESL
jgi:hypothetical protein